MNLENYDEDREREDRYHWLIAEACWLAALIIFFLLALDALDVL